MILDRREREREWQYLVWWKEWDVKKDKWLPGKEVVDLEALDRFMADSGLAEKDL